MNNFYGDACFERLIVNQRRIPTTNYGYSKLDILRWTNMWKYLSPKDQEEIWMYMDDSNKAMINRKIRSMKDFIDFIKAGGVVWKNGIEVAMVENPTVRELQLIDFQNGHPGESMARLVQNPDVRPEVAHYILSKNIFADFKRREQEAWFSSLIDIHRYKTLTEWVSYMGRLRLDGSNEEKLMDFVKKWEVNHVFMPKDAVCPMQEELKVVIKSIKIPHLDMVLKQKFASMPDII